MIKKKEKGFALVMSLVLLMAMTLMGGALIVISASDHKSNNISDEYQQTFYVAETALIEGEKYIINQFLGPYDKEGDRDTSKRGLPENGGNYKPAESESSTAFYKCFYSFSDLNADTFKILKWNDPDKLSSESGYGDKGNYINIMKSYSFYNNILAPSAASKSTIVEDPIKDVSNETKLDKDLLVDKELKRLKLFDYIYFITNIGSAPFKGYGTSIKKGASDSGNDGIAYRIYGCGHYDPDKGSLIKNDKDEIIVALESTLILPK
tara:strand:+ start:639 stop:1433 length:795 start_codon:yes stop_codon:yes gene_type:complete